MRRYQPQWTEETSMTQQAHVQALAEKHAALDRIIAQEINRPSPDSLRLAQLKRQKLKLKEQMRGLQH